LKIKQNLLFLWFDKERMHYDTNPITNGFRLPLIFDCLPIL